LGVKLFASEIQPIATRATATSLAQSANCVSNFFVAFITPVLLASSSSGIYFLFGSCAFATVAVCATFMPETRGQALESIGESFLNHRSNVGSWAPVRILRKLSSWVGRTLGRKSRGLSGASSSASSLSVTGERAERAGMEAASGMEEPSMAGALGEEPAEVVTPVSPESPASAMNGSEEGIELGILAVPAPA
jgi:hypothetical protein